MLLHDKETERRNYQEKANDTESMLSHFLRHYKQELVVLYAEKGALHSRKDKLFEKKDKVRVLLSEAFEEKDKAYTDLCDYKDCIDSWYAKSDRTPWLLGNAGKKLPKHSLFGQSFSDLDSYKYHRDSAYEDVSKAKSRIASLKQDQQELSAEIGLVKREIGELCNKINQVKRDRFRMYDLKKEGHNRSDLQTKHGLLLMEISRISAEINKILECRQEYVSLEENRYGVVDLDVKIAEIEQRKRQLLAISESEESQQERKRLHREAWLRQRGI